MGEAFKNSGGCFIVSDLDEYTSPCASTDIYWETDEASYTLTLRNGAQEKLVCALHKEGLFDVHNCLAGFHLGGKNAKYASERMPCLRQGPGWERREAWKDDAPRFVPFTCVLIKARGSILPDIICLQDHLVLANLQ